MLDPRTLGFLKDLGRHKAEGWFEANRERYDAAHGDLLAATSVLIEEVGKTDGRVPWANPDPRKCLTRIRRDPRFAKGRPPDKTDVFIMLNPIGDRRGSADYFLRVEPGNCHAGASYFVTQPEPLSKIHDRIVARCAEWEGILDAPKFRKSFPKGLASPSSLVRVPRGYDPYHPAANFLRMKGFGAHHSRRGPPAGGRGRVEGRPRSDGGGTALHGLHQRGRRRPALTGAPRGITGGRPPTGDHARRRRIPGRPWPCRGGAAGSSDAR